MVALSLDASLKAGLELVDLPEERPIAFDSTKNWPQLHTSPIDVGLSSGKGHQMDRGWAICTPHEKAPGLMVYNPKPAIRMHPRPLKNTPQCVCGEMKPRNLESLAVQAVPIIHQRMDQCIEGPIILGIHS